MSRKNSLKKSQMSGQSNLCKKNLLELPDLVLQEIFSYCASGDERNLLNLTETCKFIKNYIETNPELKKEIGLNIDVNHGTLTQKNKEVLRACLNSNRNYGSVFIVHQCERFVFEEVDPGMTLKMLVDKNATTIKKFVLRISPNYIFTIIDVVKYMERLNIVEHVELHFADEVIEYKHFSEPIKFALPNKFEYLKYLELRFGPPLILELFKNCKLIEELIVSINADIELNDLHPIIDNCKQRLKCMEIMYESVDIEETKICEFLDRLTTSGIDLNSFNLGYGNFKIRMHHASLKDMHADFLFNFLRSQKNLKEFTIASRTNVEFLNKLGGFLSSGEMEKLKAIDISFVQPRRSQEFLTPWNFNDIETAKFYLYNFGLSVKNMFNRTSKLKCLNLTGFDLQGGMLEKISMHHRSLTRLHIFYCENYESNDILYILKYLKKLKYLHLDFPDKSRFYAFLLESKDDLELPEIEEVFLKFNKLMSSSDVSKLLEKLKNLKTFSCRHEGNIDNTCDIATKILPNLKNLYPGSLELTVLQKIQSNIEKFNIYPRAFKINFQNIEHWIKKEESSSETATQSETML